MKRCRLLTVGVMTFAGCCLAVEPASPKPNILVILADDLGYSDIGCYGSEIATPNLDGLARNGLRFTQCYNTARCWPTRCALVTGYYPQQTNADPRKGLFPVWTRTLPHWLKPLGYRSYHSGKWHVNGAPKPVADGGFDRSYDLEDHDRHFGPKRHLEDDVPLPPVAKESGYYTSTAFADHAIRCLKEHAEKHAGQPFFSYLAFTVPHFPLHAPAEDIARYRARYTNGWEALRAERLQRMRAQGLVSCGLSAVERQIGPPYPFPEQLKRLGDNEVNRPLPWDALTPGQRAFQADKMAVHAAMVDRMDREIGRVLDQLRAMGAWDNTLVLFLSDNGASAEIMVRGDGHDPQAAPGSAESYLCLGPGWSNAANTPFRRHKTWVHEGGIATPLIAHWPKGIAARGELRRDLCHVIDFVPTLLSLAGAAPALPAGAPPFPGINLAPAFAKDGATARDNLFFSHEGNRALRTGDFKLVSAKGDGGDWELYDLAADRAEQNNLAAAQPERVRTMAARWQALSDTYVKDAGTLSAEAQARKAKKPNVVLLLADQWRAKAMGYAADPKVKTPNLDRLADASVNFRNAVSVCPVCTPYRASLLTGRFPTSTGMFLNDLHLPDNELCLAEIYKAAGYDTAYIGKWHLDGHGRSAFVPRERRQGWDYWKGAECDHNYQHSHYYEADSDTKKFWDGYDAYAQTRDAQSYLRAHATADKPFVLMVAYGTPHFPHSNAPEDLKRLYPPESLTLAPNVSGDEAKVRQELQGYYAHCTALDRCVGDLLATLDETGQSRRTLLVFTSDHGEMMGSHGIGPYQKQVAWDEAARVPFLLRMPGAAPRSVAEPLTTPDILPTLLGLTGVAKPATLEGEDLSSLVRGGPERNRAALYMQVSPFIAECLPYRAVRTATHTLIRQKDGPTLLFDDAADPYQMTNLAEKPECAALRQSLDAQLDAQLKRIGDDFPTAAEALRRWGLPFKPGQSAPYGARAAQAKGQAPAVFTPHRTNDAGKP